MSSKALVLCCAVLQSAAALFAQSQPKPFNANPSRIVGQPAVTTLDSSNSPNIVEGKELWRPSAVAVDTTVSPPALYVSDTLNNRVLGWSNAVGFAAGDPASIVIGQRDMRTTYPKGPGTTLTRGLNSPTGILVDPQGNLYVVDAGNNRILRYPKPFASADNRLNPDLVIGQADFTSNRPNRGATITADSMYPITAGDSHATIQQLVFDAAGNLWFTDTGNHRVLRYSKAADGKAATTADIVLGQISNTAGLASGSILDKTGLRYPTGVAIDSAGRIYVSDGLSRVLVYVSPVPAGNTAVRLLGVLRVTQPARPNATEFNLPLGLVMIGDTLGVVDPGLNRIVVYDPYDSWGTDTPTASSPPAKIVVGQLGFTLSKASAARDGLRSPLQAAMGNNEMYVADGGNNRVVVYPPGLFTSPFGTTAATRVIGQRDFGYSGANIVDGRGMYLSPGYVYSISGLVGSFTDGCGVVVDTKSSTPRLYVSDTYNHRVLGYKDARNVRPGDTADLVIGQHDLFGANPNGPLNDEAQRDDSTLYLPAGLAVAANGDLWVADRGNGRVLRFPQPFAQTAGAVQHANLVIGQRDFADRNTDVSDSNMASPYGIAFMPEGHLLVSDSSHSRVLLFRKPASGDFSNGMHANAVYGQPDFVTSTIVAGSPDRMALPHGIAVDSSGRLYVADMGNNRIMVLTGVASGTQTLAMLITNSTTGAGLRGPIGVAIDPSGSIWVAELLGNNVGQVLRYPEFSLLQLMPVPLPDFTLTPGNPTVAMPPVALTLDGAGNLIVAEFGNRVSFYFPPLWTTSAANYLPDSKIVATYSQPCCAPGSIATLWPFSTSGIFGKAGDVTYTDFNSLPNPVPLPKTLGDLQVTMSSADYTETASPLYVVSAGQINFEIPKDAPAAGSLDITLVRPSTGQVLAAGSIAVRPTAPGLLMQTSFPIGTLIGAPSGVKPYQIAAQNLTIDPTTGITCNGMQAGPLPPSCPGGVRPAARGEYISIFATGQGVVSGMPDDGAMASGVINTPGKPRVLINTAYVADSDVQYSGLAPGLIGVWQINVKVPDTTPPGAVRIMVVWNDVPSSAQTNPYTVIHVK